jgi:hypothetical protein
MNKIIVYIGLMITASIYDVNGKSLTLSPGIVLGFFIVFVFACVRDLEDHERNEAILQIAGSFPGSKRKIAYCKRHHMPIVNESGCVVCINIKETS